jgi:hypothetical protein
VAVASASASSFPAPRAEFVDPLRNRVAAITGADVGVDATASNAFKPFTPV